MICISGKEKGDYQTLAFTYKRILVPYDSSKPSENALQQAIQLANIVASSGNSVGNIENIQIILLHVVERIHIRIPGLYFSLRLKAGKPMKEFYEETYEEIKNDASKMLYDIKRRIERSAAANSNKRNTKISCSSVSIMVIPQVTIGNPSEVVVDVANNKEKVDLIIMGSTGLKGISKVRVFGSVSRAVSENADCPIMLVH
jgi:nucleotide-binding universal stress UspA family protein